MKNRWLIVFGMIQAIVLTVILGWTVTTGFQQPGPWQFLFGAAFSLTAICTWFTIGRFLRSSVANARLRDEVESRHREIQGLRRSVQKYREFFNRSQSGMLIIDPQTHQIVDINESALKMVGAQKDAVLGHRCHNFLCPAQEGQCPITDLNQRVDDAERELITLNGERVPILKRVFPIVLDGQEHLLESFIDISRLKQTRSDLEMALSAAMAANITKNEFLANMSHEIRTPMNGIIGMSNIMLNTRLDDDQVEFMQIIQSSADSLLRIVNDILDVSKVESGALEMEQHNFDLQTTVEEAVDAVSATAHEKGLEIIFLIEPSVPRHLVGDAGRLKQVLLNLLGNAIKFTHQGEVFLHVAREAEEDVGPVLRFTVKDTGIGIPEDQIEHIFRSFFQVDTSSTRKYGGTGLGLVLAKNIIELMNGAIEVQSIPGKGSAFTFSARFRQQRPSSMKTAAYFQPIVGVGAQPKRILCVDGSPTGLLVLRSYLEFWGMQFSQAEDSAKALPLIQQAADGGDPYDLLVIDQKLPDMDGLALVASIQANPALAGTQMVMLTTMGAGPNRNRLAAVGITSVLSKPIKMAQFHKCLCRILKEHGSAGRKATAQARTTVAESATNRKSAGGSFILVVEDNFINQKIVTKILALHGYQTEVANNGHDAVLKLSQKAFDLVLMDVQMPLMNGLEATAAIRDSSGPCLNHQVPIVALTANAMPGDRSICLEAGMDDYLSKPVNPDALIQTIQKYVNRDREKKVRASMG